ncbi:hypothetical protein IWX92DRAFT_366431, partial [Phyllosticta citricarpa]
MLQSSTTPLPLSFSLSFFLSPLAFVVCRLLSKQSDLETNEEPVDLKGCYMAWHKKVVPIIVHASESGGGWARRQAQAAEKERSQARASPDEWSPWPQLAQASNAYQLL